MARPRVDVMGTHRAAPRRLDARRERRRRRRRVTLTVVALSVLASSSWALVRSPLFALDGISISGTKLLTRSDVLQLSGLRIGQNMLSVHPGDVEARLGRIPIVRDVSVVRMYPSRVRITIVEREAAFVLQTLRGGWLLDAGGTVLTPFSEVSPGLPTIAVAGEIAVSTGSRIRHPSTARALGLWRVLPSELRESATAIEVGVQTGVALVRRGLRIEFGSLDRLAEKFEAVRQVLETAGRQGRTIVGLDVTAPMRPAAQLG